MYKFANKILFFILIGVAFSLNAQELLLSPSPLYMGKIPVGSSSERQILLYNITAGPITVSSITIDGTDQSLFTVIEDPGNFTLGPIEKKAISIKYKPDSAVENTALFTVESSAGTFSETLSGYGIQEAGGLQLFERILGTNEDDNGSNINQTRDGGFIIVGSTTPFDEDYRSVYLIKTDAAGKVEWTAIYGDDKGVDSGADVIQTEDGGYLVLGRTENFGVGGFDILLLRYNSDGEYQWKKTYGSVNEESGSRIIAADDGGYFLLGQTTPRSGIGKNMFLVKTDAEGTEQWRTTYGGENGTGGDDMIQLSDGNFAIVGFLAKDDDFQVYFIKIDDKGDLIWEKSFGGSAYDTGSSVRETRDGGFVICGYTSSMGAGGRDGYVVRLDDSGSLLWEETFGHVNNDQFEGIAETPAGNFIAVGNTVTRITTDEQYTDAFMVKLDKNGNHIWSKQFGGYLSDGWVEILKTNDGGYVNLGNTQSYSKSRDIYLSKVNNDGVISSIDKEQGSKTRPDNFVLYQNYPNPFNASTRIKFTVPQGKFEQHVSIKLIDILGHIRATLLDTRKNPGVYEIQFTANHLSSGVYFYQLKAGESVCTKKLILLD